MEENIIDIIENMPEHQKIRRLDQMQFALEIFDGNGIDLSSMIDFGTNLENRHIYATHNRHLFMKFASELNRHLHNFIASTYTLMSITNNVIKNYKKELPDFFKDYENKNSELYENPVFNIFIQLRNYVQHVKLILPLSHYEWDLNKGESLSLHLYTETIANYINGQKIHGNERLKMINKNTVSYLNGFDKEIDLKNLFDDYIKLIHKFYNWVYSNLSKIHKDDVIKVNNKRREGRKAYVPLVLATNITLYKQRNMGEPDVIFLNTMDGRIFDKIKNENKDIKQRMQALVDHLDNDIGLSDEIKKEIMGLI